MSPRTRSKLSRLCIKHLKPVRLIILLVLVALLVYIHESKLSLAAIFLKLAELAGDVLADRTFEQNG